MLLQAVDKKKETEGVWIDYRDGIELLIARDGNPDYERWIDEKLYPWIMKFRHKGRVPAEIRGPIEREGRARFVLKDWKNVQFEEGGPDVPGNLVENRIRAFTMNPAFYEDVVREANVQSHYYEEAKKADAENLSDTVSGSLPAPSPGTAKEKEMSDGLKPLNGSEATLVQH